ncbi:hypothetical protein GOBAR_AA39344 [Gossypium barbadense]|uniref:Uncharacterized protein n=2 Tax=Gossypium TaxID=3633 RepID=A0A2P5VRF3_GOSBA|nr:hypothetical protein GOBAR_AA39344 [Gossypium barbadense]TYH27295.1 hypothetical protein ES288_A02G058100v1 [Gossypium darwinii]
MFNPYSKNIIDFFKLLYNVTNSPFSNNPSLFFTIRPVSNVSLDQSRSFTVSYLTNNLGFSPESALRASKCVHFKTPKKADAVIAFLEKYGFSDTQIRKIIEVRPHLLRSDLEKTLLPKIHFFQSKGGANRDISKLLLHNPRLFSHSLKKLIIPSFNQLSSFLQSDSKAIIALRRNPFLIPCNFDVYMLPNVKTLLDNGVPESSIRTMFNYHSRSFIMLPDRFKEIVKDVKEMGFNPLLLKFLHAVILFRKVSKSAMEGKFDVYKKWGWSDEEIWKAFRKFPGVLDPSKEKITAIMDFLVNEMGFESLIIANHPTIVSRSLEKLIVPRALFARELLSKGLIKDWRFSVMFGTSEKVFVQRFVNKYKDKAPELLKLYEEKLEFAVRGKYKSNRASCRT